MPGMCLIALERRRATYIGQLDRRYLQLDLCSVKNFSGSELDQAS